MESDSMWILSLLCVTITGTICLLAIFTNEYDDTLCQRIALAGIIFTCVGRAENLIETQMVEPNTIIFHLCLAAFSVSTAIKVVYRHRGIVATGCWPFVRSDSKARASA